MLLVTLAGQREHSPDSGLPAGLGEDVGLIARDMCRALEHLVAVIQDAVSRILRKDDQVEPGPSLASGREYAAPFLAVLDHLPAGVQSGHLVVDDADPQ